MAEAAAQDKLFSGYRQGYFKALLDVREYLESHDESLAYRKVVSKKGNRDIRRLLTAMLGDIDACLRRGENINVVQRPDGSLFIKEEGK